MVVKRKCRVCKGVMVPHDCPKGCGWEMCSEGRCTLYSPNRRTWIAYKEGTRAKANQ